MDLYDAESIEIGGKSKLRQDSNILPLLRGSALRTASVQSERKFSQAPLYSGNMERSYLLKIPIEVLTIILDELKPTNVIRLWACGNGLLQLKLVKAVRSLLFASVPFYVPQIDFSKLSRPPFQSISSVHVDTTGLPTKIAVDSAQWLPKTLRSLRLRSSNAFAPLAALLDSNPSFTGLIDFFPHLEVLDCDGSGLVAPILRNLPASLLELRFVDYDFSLDDESIISNLPESIQILCWAFGGIVIGERRLPATLTHLELVGASVGPEWQMWLPPHLKRFHLTDLSRLADQWSWSVLPRSLTLASFLFKSGPAKWRFSDLPRGLISFQCWCMDKENVITADDVQDICRTAPHLTKLDLQHSSGFDVLPEGLRSLSCSFANAQAAICQFPPSLTALTISNAMWRNIAPFLVELFPTNLVSVRVPAIKSSQIELLPRGLKSLFTEFKGDLHFEDLPPSLEVLNAKMSSNRLSSIQMAFIPPTVTKLNFDISAEDHPLDSTWPAGLAPLSMVLRSFNLIYRKPVALSVQNSLWSTLLTFSRLKNVYIHITQLSTTPICFPPKLRSISVSSINGTFPFHLLPKSTTDIRAICTIPDIAAVQRALPPYIRTVNLHRTVSEPLLPYDPSLFPPSLISFSID